MCVFVAVSACGRCCLGWCQGSGEAAVGGKQKGNEKMLVFALTRALFLSPALSQPAQVKVEAQNDDEHADEVMKARARFICLTV